MKRILVCLLALLSLLPLFVACQGGGGDAETTDGGTKDPNATEDPFDDRVPDIDYNEYDFVISVPLPWGKSIYEAEQETGETMNDAIFQRNRQIENRFNIKFIVKEEGTTGAHAAIMANYIFAGQDSVDTMMVGYTQSAKGMITQEMVLPWNDVEYINLKQPWWHEQLTQAAAICGNYYLIIGDVNWWYMCQSPVCYFNKNVAEEYSEVVGDLYQTVRDGDWTYDVCYDTAKAISNDVNGDGKYDTNDMYGAINNVIIGTTGFLYAANYQTVIMFPDGPRMNFLTTKMANIMQWIQDFCHKDNISLTEYFDETSTSLGVPIFFDDRALLYFDVLTHATKFRHYDSDFGIIPYPKYDKAQKNYTSYTSLWSLSCVLPVVASQPSRTGAIIEAMSALSRKLIQPAYYELTLMGKIKRDDESEEMLNMIFDHVIYDYGFIYAGDIYQNLPAMKPVMAKTPFVSWYRSRENALKTEYWELYEYVYENQYGVKPEKPEGY